MQILWFLVIGVAAGWIASLFVKDSPTNVVGDLVVGIIGAVIGGHLFSYFGVTEVRGHFGAFITALVGAVVLLGLVRMLKK